MPARELFGLTMTTRCVYKVSQAYQRDHGPRISSTEWHPIRRPHSPLGHLKSVNIWTVNGRMWIPIQFGEHQAELLKNRQGESIWFTEMACSTCTPPATRLKMPLTRRSEFLALTSE
jgi:hypothetical protein